jgi:tetratricopeptide (TPR) repeat protein
MQALAAQAALAVIMLISLLRPAYASPTEELRGARTAFLAGEYETAISSLTGLLYPKSRLADASALAEAHLLLGVSFYETGKPQSAAREFEEALFLDSNLKLESSTFSEGAVRFFEDTKSEIERKSQEASSKRLRAQRAEKLAKVLDRQFIIESKGSYILNYVPFGAGQFQNGQRGKGVLFLIGEATTAGLSLGLWSYQVIRYGYRGRVPRDEISTVNTIQVVQIASGAMFVGLMLWGIADSLANYEYQVRREADPEFLENLRELLEDTPKESAFQLAPLVAPNSAGLQLSLEF